MALSEGQLFAGHRILRQLGTGGLRIAESDNTYRRLSFLVRQVVSLLGMSHAAGLISVIPQALAVNKR
jgi:hypothetical protein